MKKITAGILAHVDAGKTTLSEGLLYEAGVIKNIGRVDNKDSFLDNDEQERARGITIFSKQAVLKYEKNDSDSAYITLLDTPGHVDFSAEMERALWVMDYAILVISGSDGVQGHTKTLWRLLTQYNIPVFLFINKMDQPGTDCNALMREIQTNFGDGCIDFSQTNHADFYESIAVTDEALLEKYLELIGNENFDGVKELINDERIADLIRERKVMPCYFGSALKMEGVHEFLDAFTRFTKQPQIYKKQDTFGARIYKIGRDQKGTRLTYLKITNGTLKVKDVLEGEKVNQIRIYSGEKYETVQEATRGMVCAVTGLNSSLPGQGIGIEEDAALPLLEPVLTYTIELPEEMDCARMIPKLRELEEEEPALHVLWQEETDTIQVKMMGPVQIEILQKQIMDRFGVQVSFGMGKIVYKETITNVVEGVGHFEPLRHYAEVHLLLEPGDLGSGMQFFTDCSEDLLDKNWQRLILTHLEEKEHVGVLTGSAITDMKITVVGGRAHTKHTEGGDFRQATYRAIRQGLMQAQSKLLEPYYSFRLEIPSECVGRAMTDMEAMCGKCEPPQIEGDNALLVGLVPVETMGDYQVQVNAYTKGRGNLFCSFAGFMPCHNEEEVIEKMGYDPESDTTNPTGSVFCAHGAGFIVPWYQVTDYMHVDSVLNPEKPTFEEEVESEMKQRKAALFDYSIDEEQIDAILTQNSHKNQRPSKHWTKKKAPVLDSQYKATPKPRNKERYVIVDGYNIIHAWDDLNCLINDNLDGARAKLMDILCNYQAYIKHELIVVFDAYRVKGNLGELFDYHNIHVVYTKEAETADSYIEKLTHKISKDYYVTVATSDGLVQLITRGQNCTVMSARELKEDIERINEELKQYMSSE